MKASNDFPPVSFTQNSALRQQGFSFSGALTYRNRGTPGPRALNPGIYVFLSVPPNWYGRAVFKSQPSVIMRFSAA
ncbi:MAG: hypothetical protein PVH89_13470, partial [Gammaproteobacteria bacterium]